MNSLEELIEEISIDKEILSTLPQNNKKNRKIYLDKIVELSEKYNEYDRNLLKEIEKRSKKYDGIQESPELKKSDDELANLENYLYLLNEHDSPFEKMDIDKEILNLTYYYRKNIKRVNDSIKFCIKKLEEAGVKITPDEFVFNKYVNEYIKEIIKEGKQESLNSKFEQIYWKCPEIITYIELNIRYIYLKNEKIFIKYYKDQKDKLLSKFSEKTIRETYINFKQNNIEVHNRDKALIIKKFLNGNLQFKDYDRNSIIGIAKKYTTRNLDEIDDEELEKILVDLIKFLNTVREFKTYNEFKFIIDDVKNIYNTKTNYKSEYAKIRKEISKLEKKIIKLGSGKGGLFKKSEENTLATQNKLIDDLKQKYNQLDEAEISNKISSNLNEHSTLYDVISIAGENYKYLFKCIIREDKDIQEKEINEMIVKLREYLNWPYFIILNNVEINENKDIMLMIKDRYNLFNINITREDLAVDNLDSIISDLSKCELYYYIMENQINLQEVSETYEFKKILRNM